MSDTTPSSTTPAAPLTSAPAILRARNAPGAGRVGFVELFFDLVFVFAVTQISHVLIAHQTLEGAAQSAFMLAAAWVAWMWTTWATNWLNCDAPPVRLWMFALMALGLALAAAIPGAFGDRGALFGIAFAAFQIVRAGFAVWALRRGPANEYRNFQRILVWGIASGVLWVAGGFVDGGERWAMWGLALALDFSAPWFGFWVPGLGRSKTEDWRVDPSHMAERCALFVIVALGESIILIGATFANAPMTGEHVAGFASALIGALAMWWIYFTVHEEDARHAFAHHPDPGRLAREAYTYAHIPIVAGIVLSAVGNEITLAHPDARGEWPIILIVLGGPALFLFGSAWFGRIFSGGLPVSHLVAAALIAGVAAIAPSWSALALNTVTSLIFVCAAAWESFEQARAARIEQPLPE